MDFYSTLGFVSKQKYDELAKEKLVAGLAFEDGAKDFPGKPRNLAEVGEGRDREAPREGEDLGHGIRDCTVAPAG